jgi:hypothetical protein
MRIAEPAMAFQYSTSNERIRPVNSFVEKSAKTSVAHQMSVPVPKIDAIIPAIKIVYFFIFSSRPQPD